MKSIANALFILFAIAFIAPAAASAHCDAIDGPVVKAARKALETGNPNLALLWVKNDYEAEVRSAFQKALAVRSLSADARELADTYFFETVVRVHRAGEGEPYMGLKPAGQNLGPVIPAVDRAIESGSAESLLKLLPPSSRAEVEKRFKQIIATRNFNPNDVEAGRAHVEQYVSFMHYVEHLHKSVEDAERTHQQPKKPHDNHP